MTNAQQTPAGWYPDASAPGQLRWWDGAQWTDRAQAPYASASPLGAPAGTSTNTWQVWAIIGLFVLQTVVALVYIATIDWSAYMAFSMDPNAAGLTALTSMFSFGYVATLVVSFVGYVGSAALAYLDTRELARRGVDRPFHWAWNFFPSYGSTIYIIGRSVVARRRTGGGLAPLWAYIALFVVAMIATFIASFAMMGSMLSEIPGLYSSY